MWLPLAEYSMKHRVSISTLRRRIKAEDIQYKLDEGKYLILDLPDSHRPSLKSEKSSLMSNLIQSSGELAQQFSGSEPRTQSVVLQKNEGVSIRLNDEVAKSTTINPTTNSSVNSIANNFTEDEATKSDNSESVITAANRLLSDLKKAYTQVLQEKEEQLTSLKEEIADLRTLVRVLESENQRLKNQAQIRK